MSFPSPHSPVSRRGSSRQYSLAEVEELGPIIPVTAGLFSASYLYISWFLPVWRLSGCLKEGSGGVIIRPSPGKGRGAFFDGVRPIKRGRIVGEYRGDVLSYKDLTLRYPPVNGTIAKNDYLLEIRPDSLFIDASDESSSRTNWARYINHSSKSPNLVLELNALHKIAWFESSRQISPGDELLFDYGEKYWDGYESMLASE